MEDPRRGRVTGMTYAEYLAFEEASDERHEYVRGEAYVMAGGTPEHSLLAAEVTRLLGNALADKPCNVYSGDLRVRIDGEEGGVYPDVQVVCGPLRRSASDRLASVNPSLIVEVLSERTEAWDRGGKFELYEQLDSLRHYVLVSQGKPRIEHFARNDDGSWTRRVAGPGEAVVFEGLCALAVGAVYARVEAAREVVEEEAG